LNFNSSILFSGDTALDKSPAPVVKAATPTANVPSAPRSLPDLAPLPAAFNAVGTPVLSIGAVFDDETGVGPDLKLCEDFCLLTAVWGNADGIGGRSLSFKPFFPVIRDMKDLKDLADFGGSSGVGEDWARVSGGGSVELKKSASSCASDRGLPGLTDLGLL
jgi:hypothetical protein